MAGCTHRVPDIRLVLIRHAKSDYPIGVADRDRPLSARGMRDARAAGIWLRDHRQGTLQEPTAVVVSPARRTQQTWELIAPHLPDLAVQTERGMYAADAEAYLDILREQAGLATTVLAIGHNPATEEVARRLVGDDDSDAYRALTAKFSTASIAVIDCPDGHLTAQSGSLRAFVTPRG